MALNLTQTTVATLAVPPGSYVIWAKLWVDAPRTGTFLAGADCSLTAGVDVDNSRPGPETVTLSCSRVGAGSAAFNPVITAIRVGGIG